MAERREWGLIFKLPLPKCMSLSAPHSLIMPATLVAPPAAALPKYDRHFWFRCFKLAITLPIADLLQAIGIRYTSERVPFAGMAKFGTDDFTLYL
jgi:hypothetical protein